MSSDAELEDLAEKLRAHTAKTTRIEMAPWAKAYTVDIKEIYTELTLEKIENQPTGPEGKIIDDYKELFGDLQDQSQEEKFGSSPRPIKPRPSKKILGKGEPGFGKTCLGKKISWDWAKGLFTAVSLVFFVSLKLVRPADTHSGRPSHYSQENENHFGKVW